MEEIDHTDERINHVPQLMDIDTIMTHTLPFERFKQFMHVRNLKYE
jgi:hypothetical protein